MITHPTVSRRRTQTDRSLVFIETSDMSIASHLDGLVGHLVKGGFRVTLVANDEGRLFDCAERNGASAVAVSLRRSPGGWEDARALVRLIRLLRQLKPDAVVYGTPKAALLASVAARVAGVPRRIHVLHGLRVETLTGLRRHAFTLLDRLVERLSSSNVAVGHGLADRAVELGSMRRRPMVLGRGSAQGVDTELFSERDRETGNVPSPDFTIGFVGRIAPDKGIDSLVQAFDVVQSHASHARLLLAGPVEGLEHLLPSTVERLSESASVQMLGSVSDVPELLGRLSVLCLPTRREGLPTVLMEAGSSGVPIVATSATGVTDLVEDGVTGLLVPIDDVRALSDALVAVFHDPVAARARAEKMRALIADEFSRATVWDRWEAFLGDQVGTPR